MIDLNETSEANQPAIAAYCAEHVLGWTVAKGAGFHDFNDWYKGDSERRCVKDWNPFTNANDDYAVLKHVRETWDEDRQLAFYKAMPMHPRPLRSMLSYKPGDYCLAACRVIQQGE